MFCFTLESTDPFFNLAIEEILLKKSKDNFLILGINSPSVIIGKHQSSHREVNTRFITENNIPVIRRISGGGTVFHDRGNLNFTFIRQSEAGKQIDFKLHTQPVIDFLSTLGVNAIFEGKNDLKVDGLKISGNAEHVFRNRVLHHGTLLFSTSLAMLRNSIRKDKSYYSTRAVDSNPSSVTNLNGTVTDFKNILEFRSEMMKYFLETIPYAEKYQLSPVDIEEAEDLAATKYKTWEWNWGYGPEYTFQNSFKFNGEQYQCLLFVKDGIIRDVKIDGSGRLISTGKKLIGCRHMVNDMLEIFRKENILIQNNEIFNFF